MAHLHNAARALSSPSCQQILTEIGLYSYRQRVRVITVVKICCGLTRLRLVSPQHFDHCDDAYSLSIRVQTTLNHIRFVKSTTSTRHHSGQNVATNFDHCDDAYSLSIRVQTTLNHIRFVFYHNIKDNERNLCQDLLTTRT